MAHQKVGRLIDVGRCITNQDIRRVEIGARIDQKLMAPLPKLTRRRSLDAPDECWHVYYGDVRVGTIAIRTGMPPDTSG
jgi:hypothetical protein